MQDSCNTKWSAMLTYGDVLLMCVNQCLTNPLTLLIKPTVMMTSGVLRGGPRAVIPSPSSLKRQSIAQRLAKGPC